jgi:hypothetical protein
MNSIEVLLFNSGEAKRAAEELGRRWKLWMEFIALREAINLELEKMRDSLTAAEAERMDPVEAKALLPQLMVSRVRSG